ncbi:response regulator receiver protein [Gluconacetobacter diazotrophicus PA1 5]|uniref:Response regulator n=2 Tax=Gluconacetobacter diazotrophicus TaxID=33996 RepID=A0A7W4FE64_GLUDI|nr:response regulator [Gluconacetobacter diazotrophicus]ACI53191.1 response regulator receiver protein [Gluconacetobacter diazotrophicus PA1 5]MBB2156058.1 response regulator [Gluconacetobacter diazotrophicus]TWB10435.1 two-component system chemotaxis response regulator CheY [Gluconacetobacter diazotrophicus]CAP55627.1 putative chemotaxis protein cheY [Gluconacetobacter diazotrophicus PA1 5]
MVGKPAVRVLTIDDSRTMQGMLRKALEGNGYDVIQGGDGVEGIEVLKAASPSPNAIITDINMPRMDGFEVIEAVRKMDQFKHLPIIVLTTESDPEKKARARAAGATGWIVKPFSTDSLVAAIRRVTA